MPPINLQDVPPTSLDVYRITATAARIADAIIAIAGQGTVVPGIGADVNFSGSTRKESWP